MWILTPEQTRRLNALQRQRDLKRLGEVLAAAYPEAAARLGDRFAAFVELGAQRASVHGLTHLLAVARYLACWVAFGTEMEQREPWAAALLRDSRRSQGARVHQLGVQTLESLRSRRQPGQPAPESWAQGLVALDNALQDSGRLGTLGERERLKLGVACDLEAIDLRVTDSAWRQQYTATDGPWRREPCNAAVAAVTVQHPAGATSPTLLPTQISVLSQPPGAEHVSELRVRVRSAHRCDPTVHPLLSVTGPTDVRTLRGDAAQDVVITLFADRGALGNEKTAMGEETSPAWSVLEVTTCGLRDSGMPVGQWTTRLAAYCAEQHLVAFRREIRRRDLGVDRSASRSGCLAAHAHRGPARPRRQSNRAALHGRTQSRRLALVDRPADRPRGSAEGGMDATAHRCRTGAGPGPVERGRPSRLHPGAAALGRR